MVAATFTGDAVALQGSLPEFQVSGVAGLAKRSPSKNSFFFGASGAFGHALAATILFHVEVVGFATRLARLFAHAKMRMVAALSRNGWIGDAVKLRWFTARLAKRDLLLELSDSALTQPGLPHAEEFDHFVSIAHEPLELGLMVRLAWLDRLAEAPSQDLEHSLDHICVGHLDSDVDVILVFNVDHSALAFEESGTIGYLVGCRSGIIHANDYTTNRTQMVQEV